MVVVNVLVSPSAAHRLHRSSSRWLAATYGDILIIEVVAAPATEEAVETVAAAVETAAVGFCW